MPDLFNETDQAIPGEQTKMGDDICPFMQKTETTISERYANETDRKRFPPGSLFRPSTHKSRCPKSEQHVLDV